MSKPCEKCKSVQIIDQSVTKIYPRHQPTGDESVDDPDVRYYGQNRANDLSTIPFAKLAFVGRPHGHPHGHFLSERAQGVMASPLTRATDHRLKIQVKVSVKHGSLSVSMSKPCDWLIH